MAYNLGNFLRRFNDGGVYGSTPSPTWTKGKSGSALQFDGVGEYVDCGLANEGYATSLNTTGAVTIEAWVLFSGKQQWNAGIVDKRDDNEHYWKGPYPYPYAVDVLPSGAVQFEVSDGTNRPSISTRPLSDDEFHHVAFTRTPGGKLCAYSDGKLDQEQADTITGSISNNSDVFIGVRNRTEKNHGAAFFKGIIDEVSIYNRVLSAKEIEEHYEKGN